MDIRKLMLESIENEEFEEFLCGFGKYKVSMSQYVPGTLPTDTERILTEAVYPEYLNNISIKSMFESALFTMISGTTLELYMVIVYYIDTLFDELNNIATFTLSRNRLSTCIKEILNIRNNELKDIIKFPDGIVKVDAWNDIIRWNKLCKAKYGVEFLD